MHKAPLSTISHINPPLHRKVGDGELVSFVGMQDVSEDGGLRLNDPVPFGSVKNGFTRFIENDVLFAKITPCMENGKGAIAAGLSNFIGCGSTEFHVLRANEHGSHEFIFHVTKSEEFRQKAEMNMTGSAGQRRVPSDFFRKFSVYIPEKEEQQKIAHILTTVDNLIEKTKALIDKYTAVKQGMMHDLFTRGIDLATGQLRPSYEQAPELYKETELGWVPREWGVVTLGSLATRITNGFVGVATPFYSTNESGVQYLYGNNVRKDRLELHSVLYVTREFHEKQKKSQLQPGDMLTVQSGHIGTTAVVPPDAGDMNCHALIITKFKAGIANSDFISAYCNSEIGMQRMESIFIGSTILHINTSDLKEFNVLLPSLDEQNAIYGRLAAINSKINTESGLLEKAKLQKKGLMQDLLTGRVRVNAHESA